MSGSLDYTIKRKFLNGLHHESGRLGLLLGEGYTAAMGVVMSRVVMCLLAMTVAMVRMIVFRMVVIVFRMIVIVFRMIVTMRCMCLMCMVVVVVATIPLLASTSSEEHRRTQASK